MNDSDDAAKPRSAEEVAEALRRSEHHLAAAQRITHCGSWELDLGDLSDIDGNSLVWTDEVFRIFGYEPGAIAVTNESFYRAVHPDDRERVRAAIHAAIETGAPCSLEHRVIRPDGSVRFVHEESELVCDASGRPIRMIGTVQDITVQRHTEAQLVFSDRMASLGQMAGGIAHEINNPLTAVVANLDLIARTLKKMDGITPALLEQVADAVEGADRVREIVRDLSAFAKADEAKTVVDVIAVIESSLRLATHELKHRANVVRDYAGIVLVVGNEARLGQLFLNLLRNAAAAIAEGDPDNHEVRISVKTDEARGRVVIRVADTGAGIAPEHHARIFEPFYTTNPGVGTGLGLSICQRIVSALGGKLTFTSELGRGSEFVVELAAPTNLLRPRGMPSGSRPPLNRPRRARVLVIDDEPPITTALEHQLGEYHDITTANEPLAALELIREDAGFDVILCDLMMPRLTGLDLYKSLDTPLASKMVLMTGGAFPHELRDLMARTSVATVVKPFELDELLRVISAVIARRN
ncbi:MAG: PAS domain-containing protein [Kofleriaceae bacterium]|nr:PAS domain-containing protein [Kofleriaceae bacterium]